VLLVEVVEVGLGLEEVGADGAVLGRRVRRDVVGELLDLQLQARLLREVVLDEGQDLGVRYGARGDDQGAVAVGGGVVLVGAAGGEAEGEGSGGEDSGGDLGGVTHEKCLSLVVRPLGARGAARSAVVLGGWGGPGQATLLMSAAAGSPAFSRRSLGPGPERAPRRCRERAA